MRRFVVICLGGGALLLAGPAASASAAPIYNYKATTAQADIVEGASLKAKVGPVSWTGDGHLHWNLAPEDGDLPPLPVALIPGQKNGVGASVEEVRDGSEDLTNAEGNQDTCSGVFGSEDTGIFAVLVKQSGNKLQTTWEVPHGFSTGRCGVGYDLFPANFKTKSSSDGEIGDNRIVLKLKDSKQMQQVGTQTTIEQTVSWNAKMVLKRTGRIR